MSSPTLYESRIPLSKQYAELLKKQAETDASDKLYPVTKTGFFKVVSKQGKNLGFGFYCPRCRISACGLDESAVVRHCGKESRFPNGLFGWLAMFGLRSYTLSRSWF